MECKSCNEHESNTPLLSQIKLAIDRANRLTYWKNKCLVQSFAARRMLNKRKIQSTLQISVKKGSNQQLEAHASLKTTNFELVSNIVDFTPLYSIE